MKLLDMDCESAKKYFLQGKVYCNINLPSYFNFDYILVEAERNLKGKKLKDFYASKNAVAKVNSSFDISFNKDGAYQWRKLSIINPLIYFDLVRIITEQENWEFIKKRFREFANNEKIVCTSLPINASNLTEKIIHQWWSTFEQEIISMSAKYDIMGVTDIANCYSSIYTHTVSWALYGKKYAKENKSKDNLGSKIDSSLSAMHYGQTNGIPEGSGLTDFIAEIILGYADMQIAKKLEKKGIDDYKILRYRDDYRIFSDDKSIIDVVLKVISEILLDLNLKLNAKKTYISSNILEDSIKPDKLFLLDHNLSTENPQKRLYSIWKLADNYPGCGGVIKELQKFGRDLDRFQYVQFYNKQLIAIVINIMTISSKYYPSCVFILSKLMSNCDSCDATIDAVFNKFAKIPNTDYLEIWLQRITIKNEYCSRTYESQLCKKVSNPKEEKIWDWSWLQMRDKEKLDNIIDEENLDKMGAIMSSEEISLFNYNGYYDE